MITHLNSTVARAIVGTVGMAFCAGLFLVGATAPALADTVRTTTVSYGDLNVATASGRAALDRRVAEAARTVCTSADVGPSARVEESRCIRHAVAAAKPTIG